MSVIALIPQNDTDHDNCTSFCQIQGGVQDSFVSNKGSEFVFPPIDSANIARNISTNGTLACRFWQGNQGILRARGIKPSLEFIAYVVKEYSKLGFVIDEYFIAGMLWCLDNEFRLSFNSVWNTLEKSCGLTIL